MCSLSPETAPLNVFAFTVENCPGSQRSVENPRPNGPEEARSGLFSGPEVKGPIARRIAASSGPGSGGNEALRTIPGVEAVTAGQSSWGRDAGLEGRDPSSSSDPARPA